jgi:hypothetical protein
MLIAAMHEAEGTRKRLVIGLMQENIDGLLNDMPIMKRLDGNATDETEGILVPGLEDWELIILGPEDLARFVATYT